MPPGGVLLFTTRQFWEATAERAAKTFAQTAVSGFTANQFGILDAPWGPVASLAGMAAVLSVLSSIASARTGGGPSLTNSEVIRADQTYEPRHAGPDTPDPRFLDGDPA